MQLRVPTNFILTTHIVMAVVCLFYSKLNAVHPESSSPASFEEFIEAGKKAESPDGQFYYFNKALALRPDDPMALSGRALAYLRKMRSRGDAHRSYRSKERAHAMSDIRRAITLNPKLAVGFFAEGFGFTSELKFDEAIVSFTKAIELDPTNPLFYLYRADAYINQKEYDKALNDCDAALKADPNAFRAYLVRAAVYRNLKDPSKEFEEYAKAVGSFPEEAEVYWRRAWAYKKQGNIDAAIADFSETIKRDPKNLKAYEYRASLYARKGMKDLAKADEKMRAQMHPDYHAGQGYALGASDEAIAAFSKAIELEPWRGSYYMNRGKIWLWKKKYKNAMDDLNKAIDIYSPELAAEYTDSELAAMAYSYRGATYGQMGDNQAALADLKRACDLGSCDDYKSAIQSISPLRGRIVVGTTGEPVANALIVFVRDTTVYPLEESGRGAHFKERQYAVSDEQGRFTIPPIAADKPILPRVLGKESKSYIGAVFHPGYRLASRVWFEDPDNVILEVVPGSVVSDRYFDALFLGPEKIAVRREDFPTLSEVLNSWWPKIRDTPSLNRKIREFGGNPRWSPIKKETTRTSK